MLLQLQSDDHAHASGGQGSAGDQSHVSSGEGSTCSQKIRICYNLEYNNLQILNANLHILITELRILMTDLQILIILANL